MKTIKTTAFAAVQTGCHPPYILPWAVAHTAMDVRAAVAENWRDLPGQPDKWKAAMRDGIRVRKVKIETIR